MMGIQAHSCRNKMISKEGRQSFMKTEFFRKAVAVGLAVSITAGLLVGCGGSDKDSGNGKDASFTWWIYKGDGDGRYYENYDESPVVQYINAQYWDTENGGIAKDEESGTKLNLSFLEPIAGEEQNNFNTMISTGEYPELIDLNGATESAQALHESGVLMDITEYVEKYMPNYLAYLDENPEVKPMVQCVDEDGKVHYYAVYTINDGVSDPFEGTCYRRDWIVKYAEPTQYVWDWDSDYIKENGHPAVTPLEKAVKENNLEGWKENEVKEFKAEPGDDPDNTYSDNVIFPSGTENPITISDWEWMLSAFDKAIEERGWSDNTSAFGFSIPYYGFVPMGDIVSSFGGGNGFFYLDAETGKVSFDGTSDNFKAFLECMSKWDEEGWLDSQFHTRATDMFFQINSAGTSQGMVGMWCGLAATLGTALRPTCQNAEDQADAYVMGCALPINDMYGTEEQMYQDPDCLFMGSRVGKGVGITTKAEKKDLAALFTYLDWTYTMEGAKTIRMGLNEEQYKSVTLEPDLMKEYNLTTAYTTETDENGNPVYTFVCDTGNTLKTALMGQRMDAGRFLSGTDEYSIDAGGTTVTKNAMKLWKKYVNTGTITEYTSLFTASESETYNNGYTPIFDYMTQKVPDVIHSHMENWDAYAEGLEQFNTDEIVEIYQKYADIANAAEK